LEEPLQLGKTRIDGRLAQLLARRLIVLPGEVVLEGDRLLEVE
jgi:hypothetical protein